MCQKLWMIMEAENIHGGKDLCLFCSLTYPKCLQQCVVCSRCSIIFVEWMDERLPWICDFWRIPRCFEIRKHDIVSEKVSLSKWLNELMYVELLEQCLTETFFKWLNGYLRQDLKNEELSQYVFISSGCHSKIPQLGGLNNNRKVLFSQCRRLEA